jgi:hypothetical protein
MSGKRPNEQLFVELNIILFASLELLTLGFSVSPLCAVQKVI